MFACAPETVAQAHVDAFNTRDLARVEAVYAPAATIQFHGRDDLTVAGRDAVDAYYAASFSAPNPLTVVVQHRENIDGEVRDVVLMTMDGQPVRREVWQYRVAACQIEGLVQVPVAMFTGHQ